MMTDFVERLVKANENIPTVNIKGKQYVMVKDRVKAFRKNFPGWSIVTRIVEMDDEHVVMSAIIQDENERIMATGHAREGKNDTPINRAGSFLEVCESSAIGRACGLLGIGIDDSFGSADEVAHANVAQKQDDYDPTEIISKAKLKNLRDLCELKGKSYEWMLNTAGVDSHEKITVQGYANVVKALDKE